MATEKVMKPDGVPGYYTDTPHLDTYIVTVKIPITFARENDQVSNVAEAEAWLQRGDILESNDGEYEIVKVEKKGGISFEGNDKA